VIYGAACSYCLGKAQRLDGSYLRTFALELKEQLAQTLTAFVVSILYGARARLDPEGAAEQPLRQIIDVPQQVMCARRGKLAISVLEIYKDSYCGEAKFGVMIFTLGSNKVPKQTKLKRANEFDK